MAWYSNGYLYKKQITIDHTKVSGGSDLSNFPLLVSITDVSLKTAENGGRVQSVSGFDIIFTNSTETIKLDHEVQSYTASTGKIVMWVRLPTLSASVDTVIYLYYGNIGVSTSQSNPTGVWNTNYKGVWHLGEISGSALDSTSYGASGNYVSVTNPSDGHLNFGVSSFGYSGWLNIAAAPAASNWYLWLYKGGASL